MTDSPDDDENEFDAFPDILDSQEVAAETRWDRWEQVSTDADESTDLTSAIVEVVATMEGISMMDVREPALYDVVDVSAMEATLSGPVGRSEERTALRRVAFTYRGHRIVARSDGWVRGYSSVDE